MQGRDHKSSRFLGIKIPIDDWTGIRKIKQGHIYTDNYTIMFNNI